MANKPKRLGAKRAVIKKSLKKNGGKQRKLGRVLTQGVAAVPKRAFGSRGGPGTDLRKAIRALDATSPNHLPLPRAIGPYTVVKTTMRLTTSSLMGFACAFASEESGDNTGAPLWSQIGWVEEAIDGSISAANATRWQAFPGLDELSVGATVVPAAMTVQIMNATPVMNAQGIAYIGRSHTQLSLGGSTKTWQELGQELTTFMAPRLCSGGKLALRGVKASSYPLDMSDLADFRPVAVVSPNEAAFTWNSSRGLAPAGLAPIFIYNPFSMQLELLVTMEWRVRFGIGNPAASTHIYHPPTSDGLWSRAINASQSMGHGVVDIAEDTAEYGAEAAAVAATVGALM